MRPREEWGSRLGFVFSAVGSAVGLGNIWRFNYIVYNNGGGAFLIPFFIALLTTGVSLLILEFSMGSRFRGSAPLSMKSARKKFEWIGWWGVLSGFIINIYYSVIIAWSLIYVFKSFTLAWGSDPNSYFFNEVIQLTDSPWNLGGFPIEVLAAVLVIWLLNWIVVQKGIKRGIERANKLFIPLLLIIAIILVFRALTLPGSLEGINWYLEPNFSRIGDHRVWLDAFGQIFFSLSLGMGIMMAYGSYLPGRSDIVTNSYVVSIVNATFSILVGFAVFGTLGYMAGATGQGIDEVVQEGIGLAFVVFPQAIGLMPTLSVFTGIIFFLALAVAGFSSSISLVEAMLAAITDKFDISRKKGLNFIILTSLAGSLIYASRGGLYWLDIVDHFINIYGLVLVGLLEAVAIGWIFRTEKIREWANRFSELKIGKLWDISVKIITPAALSILLVLDIYSNLSTPYEGYPVSALGIGAGLILVGILTSIILSSLEIDK